MADVQCPEDASRSLTISTTNVTDPRNPRLRCPLLRSKNDTVIWDYRRAAIELVFHSISPLVLAEARRQMGLLFPETTTGPFIAVHMRWGDKFWEMDLPSAAEYVAAVEELVVLLQQAKNPLPTVVEENTSSQRSPPSSSEITIFLATEDPRAAQAFQEAAHSSWNVVVDVSVDELGSVRPSRGNRASAAARRTEGRAGLLTLGALLVMLEAQAFVLTTASNWSRLVRALVGDDAPVIDLRPGIW